jgi:hypothetical protein
MRRFRFPAQRREAQARAQAEFQEVREYERAHREVENVSSLPPPAPEPPACQLHPDWQPPKRLSGQPRPPKGLCPYCRRPTDVVEQVEVPHPLNVKNTTDLAEREWQFREKKAVEVAGAPGSFSYSFSHSPEGRAALARGSFSDDVERTALERIDDLREEERRRDRAKSERWGRLAFGRIEGGAWVEYRVRRIGGRDSLFRVVST